MQHLAGTPVRVGHYVVQRCLLCGYRMDFVDLRSVAVPAGQSTEYTTFMVGGIYDICTEPGRRRSVLVADTKNPTIDPTKYPELCFHSIKIDE